MYPRERTPARRIGELITTALFLIGITLPVGGRFLDEGADSSTLPERRTRLQLEGIVQGVGFRPCVNRLAKSLQLCGWVANSGDGVTVEIEGAEDAVEGFLDHLRGELPPLLMAVIGTLNLGIFPGAVIDFAMRSAILLN